VIRVGAALRMGWRACAWLICAGLVGCALPGAPSAPGAATGSAELWITSGDRSQLLARHVAGPFGAGPDLPLTIEVDPTRRYQTMVGFGASITDASAWLMRHRMSPVQREALLAELFTREGAGVGFDLTRLSIGASDFSLAHYSYDDMAPGQSDPALAHFSIDPMREDVLPVLQRARALNPQLQVIAAPWSAPAWMKSGDSLYKGALRPDRYEVFAHYLLRYIDALAAEGIALYGLSLQNEPHFEPDDYPGMRLDSAAAIDVIGRHLGPLLAARAQAPRILVWDHNWDVPQHALEVLADSQARRYVAGVAWHCYAGHPQMQAGVRDTHPDKEVWFTECSGGQWKPNWPETLPWMARNVVIGTTRHGARGVQMWNLALDENHGPHKGGCRDCRGVVTIDSKTGEVTRNLDYYALAHASKFVRPGAQRIESTAARDGVDTVAFRNADDGSIALVLCNSAPQARELSVRQGGRVLPIALPRESVATLVWKP
jgi:glucosylceramidase